MDDDSRIVFQRVETPDGISWYTERFYPTGDANRSSAECIVLIPSGEGDCHNLRQVASILSERAFHVLTFDMPGFSRTTAPPDAYSRVTPQLLAKQIVGLLDQLEIQRASIYGCSSGACATLALCSLYPSRVKCGIVHEPALEVIDALLAIAKLSDADMVTACRELFANFLVERDINDGRKKWEALGPEYHARLDKNFVPLVKGYIPGIAAEGSEIASVPENLQRRPLFWTVGSLNPGAEVGEGTWKANFEFAKRAGLTVNVDRLRSMHFPNVTVPGDLADWIHECVDDVKG